MGHFKILEETILSNIKHFVLLSIDFYLQDEISNRVDYTIVVFMSCVFTTFLIATILNFRKEKNGVSFQYLGEFLLIKQKDILL